MAGSCCPNLLMRLVLLTVGVVVADATATGRARAVGHRSAVVRRTRLMATADGSGGVGSFFAQAAKAWSDFGAKIDAEAYDFVYGRRDKQWNPDRRPEDERNTPFDISASTLSWGGMKSDDDFVSYTKMSLPDEQPAPDAVIREDKSALSDDELALLGLKQAVDAVAANAGATNEPRPIAGRELAELCFAKYSRYHDISLLTTSPFGKANRQVAVNVYAPSLGFGGFKLTEAQYLEKLDSIAAALNDWGQSQFVREFFLEAVKPRRGLPSRPRADTAVTLRLNTSPTWSQVPQEKVDSYWQFL